MRPFLHALLVLGLIASPAMAQDTLKRLTSREDLLGWEGVGRVDLAGQGYCTGVLVDPETVLTAGHCLYDPEAGGWRPRGGFEFRAGLRDDAIVARRTVVQAAVHPKYDPNEPDPLLHLSRDVALLRLDSPIPAATARPFLTDAPDPKGTVSVVSVGMGRSEALSRERTCGIVGQRDGVLAFTCSGVPGTSGAPVFRIDGGSIRIVSIISAGSEDADGFYSFGPELVTAYPDVARALRNGQVLWPAGPATARRVSPGAGRGDTGARFVRP